MAELQLPNFLAQINQGYALGQAQRANKLASLAYGTQGEERKSALSQLAEASPQLAASLSSEFRAEDAAQRTQEADTAKQIGGLAKSIIRAYEQGNQAMLDGVWKAGAPFLAKVSGKEVPDKFDPAMLPLVYQAAARFGGMPEPDGTVVGNTLVDKGTGKVLYQGETQTPAQIRELEYLRDHPDLAKFDLERRAASRPVTNLNMGPQENAFQKAVGQKDADAFVKMRDDATNAASALQQANVIEDILNKQQTGRVQEALATAGQYFGTDAGANLQALKGAIQPLILAQVKQLGSGSGISDADRRFIEAGMPGFGNDPRANDRVLKIMRDTAQRRIDLYKQADGYVRQHGSLNGFSSDLITPPAPTAQGGWSIQRVD